MGGRLTDASVWHLSGECVHTFDVFVALQNEDFLWSVVGRGGGGAWLFCRWVGGPNAMVLRYWWHTELYTF